MLKEVGGGVLHSETTINYASFGTKIRFELFCFRLTPFLEFIDCTKRSLIVSQIKDLEFTMLSVAGIRIKELSSSKRSP
jgi:hypothetical protein